MNLSSITAADRAVEDTVLREDSSLNTVSDWLMPSGCVVAIIDVQNDFCHPRGAIAKMGNDVSLIQTMMPGLHELISLARSRQVPLIFIRTALNDWFDTPEWLLRGKAGRVFDATTVPVVRAGTWGAQLYQLEPAEGELVLTKYRYSAFTYTPLALALRAKSCRTLIVGGTATHQCVEATAREAIGLGFYPVLVREAVASRSIELHNAALEDFGAHLGAILTVAELKAIWDEADNNQDSGKVRDDVE